MVYHVRFINGLKENSFEWGVFFLHAVQNEWKDDCTIEIGGNATDLPPTRKCNARI